MRLRETLKLELIVLAALLLLVPRFVWSPAFAQQLAGGPPIWSGSARCDINVKGPGYINHQTHTWTLTGAPPADGSALEYPAVWSVTGEGSQQPTPTSRLSGSWKTQGTAPGVRMAIFVRQSDQRLLVLLRHSQLNVPNGTTGAVSVPVYEFRPFPAITDAAASTHITGSSVTPITERLNPPQPLGSEGQAACTWDFVRGTGGPGSGAAAAGAISGRAVVEGAPRAGSAVPAGGAASGGSAAAGAAGAAVSPSAPAAAGCDADLVLLACQLPQMRNGLSITHSANFHVAADTSDWFTVTAFMNATEAPFAVLDFSLTGGTADGSYSIDVSEGPPSSLRSLGSSGPAHAPQTSAAWATSSASSKTLFIQVRHVAGPPANDLYNLRLSMRGSETVPLTVSQLNPGLLNPTVLSGQTGTIADTPRATDAATRLPASVGAPPLPPPTADGMPSSCSTASGKTVSVSRGLTTVVTGAIETAASSDWLVVRFPTGASVHLTISNAAAAADASDFQVQAFSNCSSMIVMTTGTGTKTLDFSDSGPHDVIVKIGANPWRAATPTYTLKLEGR